MDLRDKVANIKYDEILEFGKILFGSLDFKNVLKQASHKLKKNLNCSHVSIFLLNDKKTNIETTIVDLKGHELHYGFAIDDYSFAGFCAHYSAIIHIKNPKDDLRFAKEYEYIKNLSIGEFLLVPLVFNGELLGLIKAIKPEGKKFDDYEIEFVKILSEQFSLCVQNTLLIKKIQNQFIQIFSALSDTIAKKDTYTGGHTKRVSIFSEMIAKELNLTEQEMTEVSMSAALHDIGKIGIPDQILKKNSPLNEEEFKIMKEHPRFGYEIIGHIEGIQNVVDGMRYHHERHDGKGYPYGMTGDKIPLVAQIIAVADTFDAMISTRPYRKGLPPMVAYEEIVKNSGTQFSPMVVEAFKTGFKKTSMYRQDVVAQKKVA